MSDDALTARETLARIDRMLAESQKFTAEQHKLIAEAEEFSAEQRKLHAEADKFRRERLTVAMSSGAAILVAGAALGGLVLKLLGG